MKVLHTIELEPVTSGTVIHLRSAGPRARREKELMEQIGPAYGATLQSGIPTLITLKDAELAASYADRGSEPGLVRPRPDGPLSGLQPLVIVG